MNSKTVARTFVVLYFTLGVVVFIQSVLTAVRASGHGHAASSNWHLIGLAGVEALAALLFIIRPTLRVGGALLLLVFAVAAGFHGLHGEFPGTLLVYGAATAFVMAHGPIEPAEIRVRSR